MSCAATTHLALEKNAVCASADHPYLFQIWHKVTRQCLHGKIFHWGVCNFVKRPCGFIALKENAEWVTTLSHVMRHILLDFFFRAYRMPSNLIPALMWHGFAYICPAGMHQQCVKPMHSRNQTQSSCTFSFRASVILNEFHGCSTTLAFHSPYRLLIQAGLKGKFQLCALLSGSSAVGGTENGSWWRLPLR